MCVKTRKNNDLLATVFLFCNEVSKVPKCGEKSHETWHKMPQKFPEPSGPPRALGAKNLKQLKSKKTIRFAISFLRQSYFFAKVAPGVFFELF